MFSYELYKWLHILGILMVFIAFGGAIFKEPQTATSGKDPARKTLSILHGVGLLLVLVAGFGMLARLGLVTETPHWVWAKLAIWLALGAWIALALRRKFPRIVLISGAVGLGAMAAALALWK
jgi:hypothetical protein